MWSWSMDHLIYKLLIELIEAAYQFGRVILKDIPTVPNIYIYIFVSDIPCLKIENS